MQNKIKISQIIVVEGKYDVIKLENIVDAIIIPTNGFSVFTKDEIKDLIVTLGKKNGIIVLTDSDGAGFKIRNYINKFAKSIDIKNAYIPATHGKERRKAQYSKEGLVGVEGTSDDIILAALKQCANIVPVQTNTRLITYADLYEAQLSGTACSAQNRYTFLQSIGLPPRLSKKALLNVLNNIYTYNEFISAINAHKNISNG